MGSKPEPGTAELREIISTSTTEYSVYEFDDLVPVTTAVL
jgi:hypothetical protein